MVAKSSIKKSRIVIDRVPISIIRALRFQSEKSGDSVRKSTGSIANEARKAIYSYLCKKGVNVQELDKSEY